MQRNPVRKSLAGGVKGFTVLIFMYSFGVCLQVTSELLTSERNEQKEVILIVRQRTLTLIANVL